MATAPFGMNWDSRFAVNPGTKNTAIGQIASTGLAQPAAFANVLGQNLASQSNAFAGGMQGLAGLGNSYANTYAAYAGGLGNLAQAQANASNNSQILNTGHNAMAEAARQGALSNLGSAALGAYGSASGAAQGAWAQNQTAYNKMLSDLGAANQTGLSQLGQSRNTALGMLGDAYSRGGIGMAIADTLGGMDFGGGDSGGGFSASGPEGEIASGGYSQPSRQSARRPSALAGMADRMFGGLDATRGDLNSTDIQDRMDANYAGTLGMGTAQHLSSRDMPSHMLGQTLSGLIGLNRYNVDASSRGMDQYYQNVTPIDPRKPGEIAVNDVLSGLTYGYGDAANRLSGVQGQMGSAWNDQTNAFRDSNDRVRDLYDTSVGELFGADDIESLRREREMELMRRQYGAEDSAAQRDRMRQYVSEQQAMEARRVEAEASQRKKRTR